MTDPFLLLANWLSPAYPVGAFAYSHGLEQAVADGVAHDAASVGAWTEDTLRHGAGRNDAILLGAAFGAVIAQDGDALGETAETGLALSACAERRRETAAQGEAFRRTVMAVHAPDIAWPDETPYPVAVGAAAAAMGCALAPTAALFAQAFAANLVSAAIRLVPVGQTQGQQVIARLQPAIAEAAAEATSGLDALGGCALLGDMAAMRHETLETRLFRT